MSLALNVMFCILNALLTTVSIRLGVHFYGYGFALSLLIVTAVGLGILSRKLGRLEFETFMR